MHLHGILLRRTGPADARRARRTGDGDHAQIEIRRQTPIQPQLFLATAAAAFQRGEIEKTQVDRFLELVGEHAREKHMRDVRLDVLDRIGGMRIGIRSHQGFDQARKGVEVHGVATLIRPAKTLRQSTLNRV
jgi:hypothetical protein